MLLSAGSPQAQSKRNLWLASLAAAALCAFGPLAGARAQVVSVDADFTKIGSDFFFDFRVSNGTANTLALVDVTVPGGVSLTNLMAPTGFEIVFDPGLGLVTFLEDTDPLTPQSFAPGSTIDGFTFQSPTQIGSSPFSALDIQGNQFTGTTTVNQAVAPEPGTLSLLAAVGLGAVAIRSRRRARCGGA